MSHYRHYPSAGKKHRNKGHVLKTSSIPGTNLPMKVMVMGHFNDTVTECQVDGANPHWVGELVYSSLAPHVEKQIQDAVISHSNEAATSYEKVSPHIEYKLHDLFDSTRVLDPLETPSYSPASIQNSVWKLTRNISADSPNMTQEWAEHNTHIKNAMRTSPHEFYGVGSHLFDTSLVHHPASGDWLDQWKSDILDTTAGQIASKVAGFVKLSEWKNYKDNIQVDESILGSNMEASAENVMKNSISSTSNGLISLPVSHRFGHLCNSLQGRLLDDPVGFDTLPEIAHHISSFIGQSVQTWLNDGAASPIPCVRDTLANDTTCDNVKDEMSIAQHIQHVQESKNMTELTGVLENDLKRHFEQDSELHQKISGLFGKGGSISNLVNKAKNKIKERRNLNKQIKKDTQQERADEKAAIQKRKDAVNVARERAKLQLKQKKGQEAEQRLKDMEDEPIQSKLPPLIPVSVPGLPSSLPELIPINKKMRNDLPPLIPIGEKLPELIPVNIPSKQKMPALIPIQQKMPELIPIAQKLPALVPIQHKIPDHLKHRLVPLSSFEKESINGKFNPLINARERIGCHMEEEAAATTVAPESEEARERPEEEDSGVEMIDKRVNGKSSVINHIVKRPVVRPILRPNGKAPIIVGSSISKNIDLVTISSKLDLEEFVKTHQCGNAFSFIKNVKAKMADSIKNKVGANAVELSNIYCCPSKNTFLASTLNLTKVDEAMFNKHVSLYTGQVKANDIHALISGNSQSLKTINGKMIYNPAKKQVLTSDVSKNVLGAVFYQPENELYLFTN